MRVSIGGQPWSIGLYWGLVESDADLAERRAEMGRDKGVALRRGRQLVGVGLSGDDGRSPPPAAAALLALRHRDGGPALAIEWADTERGAHGIWLAAAAGGAVVHDTDRWFESDDRAAVRRLVDDLLREADYAIVGGASAEFGGDGQCALAAAPARDRALAAIRPLGGGTGPGQIALLLALLGAVAAAAWWVFAEPDDAAPPPTAFQDSQAALRDEAIAARHRQLAADLSGFDPPALARLAQQAGRDIQRSAAYWRFTGKRCGARGCDLAWTALGGAATPVGLAAALGLDRGQVTHDLRAESVSVAVPLGAEPPRIEADAATPLDGRIPALVDRCRRVQGLGGGCVLNPAQPVAVPNAQLLPPELRYQTGRLTLSGHLGRIGPLLDVFGGLAWVRADRLDIDYDPLKFDFEGHYVIP